MSSITMHYVEHCYPYQECNSSVQLTKISTSMFSDKQIGTHTLQYLQTSQHITTCTHTVREGMTPDHYLKHVAIGAEQVEDMIAVDPPMSQPVEH